jgi:aspartyl aminopeptidase
MTKKEFESLKKKLSYSNESAWKVLEERKVDDFSKEYMEFMKNGKTERTLVEETINILEKKGYVPIEKADPNKEVKAYKVYRSKALAIYRIPKEVKDGFNVIASHVDSPRIDLKPRPVVEDTDVVLAKTHYYGGIKKYQWFNIPLAIVGVIENGESVKVNIGNEPGDPVFVISDLLPHLDRDPNKKCRDISGETLNLIIGSKPLTFEKMDSAVKLNVLKILNEKYGIVEEDLMSAELELVPAFEPRELGFDRSMIAAYGHDDKICAFASLKALLNARKIARPTVVVFFDKEEIGSDGSTGAKNQFWIPPLKRLLDEKGKDVNVFLDELIENTAVLSSDVSAAVNPTFKEVHEMNNAAILGHGVVVTKYTGAYGKAGASDADAEFVWKIRKLLNDNKVPWQTGELGKVDVGGGGTVAKFFAEHGMHVIDMGPALLGMHSPYEVVSKADLYSSYLAYKAFISNFKM